MMMMMTPLKSCKASCCIIIKGHFSSFYSWTIMQHWIIHMVLQTSAMSDNLFVYLFYLGNSSKIIKNILCEACLIGTSHQLSYILLHALSHRSSISFTLLLDFKCFISLHFMLVLSCQLYLHFREGWVGVGWFWTTAMLFLVRNCSIWRAVWASTLSCHSSQCCVHHLYECFLLTSFSNTYRPLNKSFD